jgi:hypothetical protein
VRERPNSERTVYDAGELIEKALDALNEKILGVTCDTPWKLARSFYELAAAWGQSRSGASAGLPECQEPLDAACMSERTYTVKLKHGDVEITSQKLAHFRDLYVSTSELALRMSELIWLDIYFLDAECGVSPHDILNSINDVEKGELLSGAKPETQFKHLPLKGLWHKHYFSAHFLLTNILQALGKTGLSKLVHEVMNPAKSPLITGEMFDELAHRIVHDPVDAREASKKLTGEWVIYLRHGGKNYYLCCNTHDAGDQFIYDRIMENCVRDFPQLQTWLEAEQTS